MANPSNKEQVGAVFIKLKVVDEDSNETRFRVKMTTPLGKVKKSFADLVGVRSTSLRFFVDGRRITDDETPEQAMELHCEHCRSPSLPLASLSFCRECRVSFCSQCCQDNHSASGADGSLRFHKISKWSEALQCDFTQLVLDQLNDQMQQIKRHGEAELELIGNGMDQVKAFLQDHAKAQMENRLSRVRESITKVREALKVTESGRTNNTCTSPHTFATEAKFLLAKFGISEVVPPESSQVTNIVERAAALVASLCAADYLTDGSIRNLTCSQAVTLPTQVPLSSEGNNDSRITILQTLGGMQPEQIAPLSETAELNASPTEEIKDPSTNNHQASKNVSRESSTLSGATLSNDASSLDLDLGPEYERLREGQEKKREKILKNKAQNRQEDIIRTQRSLDLKAQDTKTPEQKRAMRKKRFCQETKDESNYEPLGKKRDQANDQHGYFGGGGYPDNSSSAKLEQAPRVSTPVGFGSVDCTSFGHTQWGRDDTKGESSYEESWNHSRSYTSKSSPYSRYSSTSPRYTPPTSAMSGRYSPCFSSPSSSPRNPTSPGLRPVSPLQHLPGAPNSAI